MTQEFTKHDVKKARDLTDKIIDLILILECYCENNINEEPIACASTLIEQISKICNNLYCFLDDYAKD